MKATCGADTSSNADQSSLVVFANHALSWQCPAISVASLVSVNAIYWVIMPMTSTLTLTAIVGSFVMLVDIAACLGKIPLPDDEGKKEDDSKNSTSCCNCFSIEGLRCAFQSAMSSAFLTANFPSSRDRFRVLIGACAICGLASSFMLGITASTLVYIGASIALLSKPLRLSERSEFPIVARFFDSVIALRPNPSSVVSSQLEAPTEEDPVVKKSSKTSPSLTFAVDPMEMELNPPPETTSPGSGETAAGDDELGPYLPSPSSDEDLLSNPESTEELSASLLPPSLQSGADSSLILSAVHYHTENDESNVVDEDLEEFELVDSASGQSDSENFTMSTDPSSMSSSSAIKP